MPFEQRFRSKDPNTLSQSASILLHGPNVLVFILDIGAFVAFFEMLIRYKRETNGRIL